MIWLFACAGEDINISVQAECGPNCSRFERGENVLPGQDPLGYAPIEENTIYNFVGGGLVVADFNGDGFDDIFLATQVRDEFFLGSSTGFVKTETWLPNEIVLSVGGSACDYDADGDLDLFITTNFGSDRLYRNEGDHFVDVSQEAGILGFEADTAPAVWGDFDVDGDVDLFVGGHLDHLFEGSQSNPDYVFPEASPNILYVNQGDGTFLASIMQYLEPEPYTLAAAWLSYEEGERPDLYLINDFGPLVIGNRILVPDGNDFAVSEQNTGADIDIYGMGVSIGDLNEDFLPDLWLSNWMQPKLLLSTGPREWYDATASVGLDVMQEEQRFSWGTGLVDFDNDGDLDAWLGYGPLPGFEEITLDDEILDDMPVQPDAFFLNTDGMFVDKVNRWGLNDDNITRGGVFADLNRDGILDLVRSSMLAPAEVFWGKQSLGDWLEIELRDNMTMNTFGIGARIDVFSTDGKIWSRWIVSGDSFSSGGPPRAHFGFGEGIELEQIDVLWPDGAHSLFIPPEKNQRISLSR